MSDRHDDQRDRERQYEIDHITFQYATEFRSGRNPRIEEYIQRYPAYADELLEYALYFHAFEIDSKPLEEPAELSLSPAGEKAMARIHAQVVATKSEPVPIQSLVQLGLDAKYSPLQLAAAVGLTVDLLGKLQAHAIAAATIPRALIQRFADVLKTAPEAIAAYLSASPAGGFYMADQQPDQQQESFLDAVEVSALSPEGKREWAEIMNAEANSSSSP
jgi:hypothetical protein